MDLLAGGFVLVFASSLGQTWFIALSGPALRIELDLSHGAFGTLYSVATLSSGLMLMWLGAAVDRVPARRMAIAVAAGLGVACLGMAAVRHPLSLLAAFFGLRLCGQGLASHVALTTVARAFPSGRGRALSLVSLGFPAAEGLVPIAATAAIGAFGWRYVWLAGAAVALVVLPALLALLLRHAPRPGSTIAEGPTDAVPSHRRHILFSRRFVLLLPAMVTSGFVVTALFFHQGALSEAKHWPVGWFATTIPVYAAASVAATLGSGFLVDRLGARRLLPVIVLPLTCAMALLMVSDAPAAALVAMALVGVAGGAGNPVVTAALLEIYGARDLGTVRALVASGMILASALSPALVGVALDAGVPIGAILCLFLALSLVAAPLAWSGVRKGPVASGRTRR